MGLHVWNIGDLPASRTWVVFDLKKQFRTTNATFVKIDPPVPHKLEKQQGQIKSLSHKWNTGGPGGVVTG